MAWAQNLLGFCFIACASQARFSWVLSGGFQVLRCAKVCLAWGNLFSLFLFIFSRFQKQRFGIFLAAVSHGLGTFFLSLAWWLAGFQVLRCAKVCLAVSHGLGTICDCGRTVGYLTMAPLHGTSSAVCACRNRFAKGAARMLFLKAACNGYQIKLY